MNKKTLYYNENRKIWILKCLYEDRSIPASHGLKWNKKFKVWETTDTKFPFWWGRCVDRYFNGEIDQTAKDKFNELNYNPFKK